MQLMQLMNIVWRFVWQRSRKYFLVILFGVTFAATVMLPNILLSVSPAFLGNNQVIAQTAPKSNKTKSNPKSKESI